MWLVGIVAFLAFLFNPLLLTPSQAEARSKTIKARDIAQLARLQRKLARAIEAEDPTTTPAPSDAPLLPSEGLGSAILPTNTICDVQRKCKNNNPPEHEPNRPQDNPQNQYPPQFPPLHPPKHQSRYPPYGRYPSISQPNYPLHPRYSHQYYPSYQPNIDYPYDVYKFSPNLAPYDQSHFYPSYDQLQYPYDQSEYYPYPPTYDLQFDPQLPISNQHPPSNIQPHYPYSPPDQHQYYPYTPNKIPPKSNYPYPYKNCVDYPPCSCYHGQDSPSNVASSPKPPTNFSTAAPPSPKPLLNDSPAPQNIPEPAATTQKSKRTKKKYNKKKSTEEDEPDFLK